MAQNEFESALQLEVARIASIEPNQVDVSRSLSELGVDSVGYCAVASFAQQRFGVTVKPEQLFELPSISAIAEVLQQQCSQSSSSLQRDAAASGRGRVRAQTSESRSASASEACADASRDVAIIGLALRVPGADSVAQYHELVSGGRCMLRDFPQTRTRGSVPLSGVLPASFKGGFLADAQSFDASFFNISPREAIAMDPQQRLLLENAWDAFSDAGYSVAQLSGTRTSVYVGISNFEYFELLLQASSVRSTHIGTGVSHSIAANRISQYFNLKGASEAIDTACSSSLVALTRAVEALRGGSCELALVSGVNVLASEFSFQVFSDAGMLSPDGQCHPFDQRANGYVRGEGVVGLVLKRADAAQRDGDRIWAVVKGAATAHSGRTNSLTAPNPQAQAEVIVRAFEDAGGAAAPVAYVEAHGTGTPLGDPVEIRGLCSAFEQLYEAGRLVRTGLTRIGSVKAQIGHLEAAAGVAGVAKAIVALASGQLPPSSYLNALSAKIDLSDAAFEISNEGRPWSGAAEPLSDSVELMRAGVSAFGFGGTNAHVLLEQAPPQEPRSTVAAGPRVFLVSAKNAEQLTARCAQLSAYLERHAFENGEQEQAWLQDFAYTLARQTALQCRLAIVAASTQQLAHGFEWHAQPSRDSAIEIATAQSARSSDPRERLLRRLAERWEQGEALDYTGLMPRNGARLLTLPGYPFTRVEFWPVVSARFADRAPPAPELVVRIPTWTPTPLPPARSPSAKRGTALDVLVSGDLGRAVADALGTRRTLRTWEMLGAAPMPGEWLADVGSADAGVTELLDLTALDGACRQSAAEVAHGLGAVAALLGKQLRTGKSVTAIQLTAGIQWPTRDPEGPTLAGALASGVFKHLGAEYRRCQSRTVDLPQGALAPAGIAEIALAELEFEEPAFGARTSGFGNECVYRDGKRYARTASEIELRPTECAAVAPSRSALITGGTGAIGLALAEDLVARGFQAIVLTGRRALSRVQQQAVDGLGCRGAHVEVFLGELGDPELANRLDRIRRKFGPVSHVFHCAGTVDRSRPAFFQKDSQSMQHVLAPKSDSLWALHDLLKDAPPQYCVLFSSLSATLPSAAAGVLDYASGNRFLDLFAAHQQARGHHYYRSIQWGRWQGMGLAAQPGGPAKGLTAAEYLPALWAVLEDKRCTGGVLLAAASELNAPRNVPATPLASIDATPSGAANIQTKATLEDASMLERVRALVALELEQVPANLDDAASFEALGIDSIVLTGLVTKLEALAGRSLDPEALITRNSIAAVAAYIQEGGTQSSGDNHQSPAGAVNAPASIDRDHFPVAVIGLACRFPGAPNKLAFWNNLAGAVDSVRPVPASRWNAAREDVTTRAPSQWGGFLDDIEGVYPKLFGMNATEAADVDPLIRLFTECGLETTEDAGYDAASLRGKRVGVFVGARASRYAERIQAPSKHSAAAVGQNFVAAYTSHLLDLRGPSLVVDSACSSSLAALHLACQSLRVGDSELALAGGVEVLLDEKLYQFLAAAGALSPDGRCRTFDAQANGFVPGEGVGAVLLKPLAAALRDGDPIYAVIEGSAMNNDGHTLGVTTPGCDGQVDVIQRALQSAHIASRAVSYVETHGTGTLIGDPIELRALTRAFEADPPKRCPVGSVKTNIGHLLSAAGIASFIKVALALHHRTLPPTLNCQRVNPRFGFESTPFFPLVQGEPWTPESGRCIAGVSAFGFGKTNVHMVLGERPERSAVPTMAQRAGLVVADRAPEGGAGGVRVHAWHPATRPTGVPQPNGFLAMEELSIGEEAAE